MLGALVALAGLAGFWWPREPERTIRTVQQESLVNPRGEAFTASFVIAGRDFDHTRVASACRWVGGECIRDRAGSFVPSNRTDTILYVSIVGDSINVVAIPRDIYLHNWQTKINAMLLYRQADGLREAVADVLGVPVDYYVIIDVNIFESVVDALGGVELNVPYRMYYRDSAADLLIDLQPGLQVLDGAQTAGFVRFRDTPRGDLDRIDNVKLAVYGLLERVRQLNVRAVGALPQLLDAYYEQVDTNVSLALLTQILPRLGSLRLDTVATLPVTREYRIEGVGVVLDYDAQSVERFLADIHGGVAREFSTVPEVNVLVTNRSGSTGLEEWYRARLISMGVAEDRIQIRSESLDTSPTRVLAATSHWTDADWFTQLLGTGKQQVDRLDRFGGADVHIELVLGEDALRSAGWDEQAAVAADAREEN